MSRLQRTGRARRVPRRCRPGSGSGAAPALASGLLVQGILASHVGNPTNLNPIGPQTYRYQVDPSRSDDPSEGADLGRLGIVEGVQRITSLGCVDHGRLDLHRHPASTILDENIDLAPSDANVAVHDPKSVANEKRGCDPLSEFADPTASQRRMPGSSSSIFTSRNVSTRTRWRNLAGRYMSHTHASSSSISK
jgi:hypothetical protein